MNHLLKSVKQLIKINAKSELLMNVIVILCAGVFGIGLSFFIMNIGEEGSTYVQLGALMAAGFSIFIMVFAGLFSFTQDFNLAIEMGKPRKHFVPAYYLLHVLYFAISWILIIGIYQFESFLYPLIQKGAIQEMDFSGFFFNPKLRAIIILGLPMISLTLSALVMRFSQKAFWILWALWMIGCLGIPRLIGSTNPVVEEIKNGIVNLVKAMETGAGWVVIAIGITIVGFVNYLILRNQRATQ